MDMTKDIYLAVLAMDSYHHGAGQGIRVNQTKIGYADIETNSDLVFSGFSSDPAVDGFFALEYKMDSEAPDGLQGETVISFRGTDFTPSTDIINDALKGWLVGGGDLCAPQFQLSTEFIEHASKDADGNIDGDGASRARPTTSLARTRTEAKFPEHQNRVTPPFWILITHILHIGVSKPLFWLASLVRSRRLELPRVLPHSDLNAARLPIPPRPQSEAVARV